MKKIIGIVIGVACIVIGIVILVSHFNAQKTQTSETNAKVIRIDSEVETDTDGFDTRWYTPVVEYTVDNNTYQKQLPNARTTNSTEYNIGDTVTIQYNSDNPEEISIKGDKGGLIGGIIFIVLGIVVTIASLIGKIV